MSLTHLIRQRQNGHRNGLLKQKGINKEFESYKSYHDDCVKIDVEALPGKWVRNRLIIYLNITNKP